MIACQPVMLLRLYISMYVRIMQIGKTKNTGRDDGDSFHRSTGFPHNLSLLIAHHLHIEISLYIVNLLADNK